MNKKLKKHLNRTTRLYWHYYHLKRDPEFKKEVSELSEKITIHLNGKPPFLPMGVEDYDYVRDPNKEHKIRLIKAFQERWMINHDHDLFYFLVMDDEDYLPPKNFYGIVISFDKDRNMFTAQIPETIQKEDIDRLWLSIQEWRKQLGVVKKRPREDTRRESAITYEIWKMLRERDKDKNKRKPSWPMIIKVVDDKFGTKYKGNIRDIKDFYESHGRLYLVG